MPDTPGARWTLLTRVSAGSASGAYNLSSSPLASLARDLYAASTHRDALRASCGDRLFAAIAHLPSGLERSTTVALRRALHNGRLPEVEALRSSASLVLPEDIHE